MLLKNTIQRPRLTNVLLRKLKGPKKYTVEILKNSYLYFFKKIYLKNSRSSEVFGKRSWKFNLLKKYI